jgi:hypothetical protein
MKFENSDKRSRSSSTDYRSSQLGIGELLQGVESNTNLTGIDISWSGDPSTIVKNVTGIYGIVNE